MAYSVAQRTREIGIRLALGAQKSAIFRLIVGQGVRLIACSLIGGIGCILATTRLLPRVLYGGGGGSAFVTITPVAMLLSLIALVACWFPAHRAAAVDPLEAIGQR
jgi:ABC-type antimicrobial peptide transport system permease subunit